MKLKTTGWVHSVSFSPDGSRIVSGSVDKTVRVWDSNTGALIRTLTGHTRPVMSVSFSPDGSRIVSGSSDDTVRVWDSNTGALIRTLTGHTSSVMSVSFSPDGTKIVSGSQDKTVRVWDISPSNPPYDDDSDSDLDAETWMRKFMDGLRTHHPMVVPPDDICVICMEGLRDTSNGYAVQLKCRHYFHANCIEGWQNAGESKSEGYEDGVTFLQSGYQMPGKKCPLCRVIATDNTYADGILRLRF
tara:strand:- start:163 stop:894 length:732 start_codon:yes stop_codon:yes gene_type:complete